MYTVLSYIPSVFKNMLVKVCVKDYSQTILSYSAGCRQCGMCNVVKPVFEMPQLHRTQHSHSSDEATGREMYIFGIREIDCTDVVKVVNRFRSARFAQTSAHTRAHITFAEIHKRHQRRHNGEPRRQRQRRHRSKQVV